MSKQKEIQIPTELSIGLWKKISNMEHLTDGEKIVRVVSAVSGETEKDILRWDFVSLSNVYKAINENITDTKSVFLPIINFNGTDYGFQPISKMSAGEYIDLESKMKGGIQSLEEVMAMLYRPITKSRFNSLEWKVKSNLKYIVGKSEDLFRYYDVEEYDVEKVSWRIDSFKDLPLSVALGAYNFFLLVGLRLSSDTLTSSQTMGLSPEERKRLKEEMDQLLQSITDGSLFSKN